MVDWSKLPDLVAVGLLAGAFASVARRSHAPVSANWMVGWVLIVFHFLAFMFSPVPGFWGSFSNAAGTIALAWAAILFMRASVPYREEKSSLAMFAALLGSYALYLLVVLYDGPGWLMDFSAVLLGAGPLGVMLLAIRRFVHPLRYVVVILQCALAGYLLVVQHGPRGDDLALNAVLFTLYLSTASHFWMTFHRGTAGAFITTMGFFLWSSVFIVGPFLEFHPAHMQIESEVWNLPKYIVAVGMILLLLEDQIAHNKHLALHDELTGLPNRRLFQDRLSGALERARRTGTHTALLTVDLNDFKLVNDTLGHHAGDLLLQNVASLFIGRVRRSDTVARTGGDEFAVILDAPTSAREAALVGRSLLDLLEQPMPLKDRMVRVGASLGVAIFPADGDDIEALCIKADLRMYEDKRSRKPGDEHAAPEIRPMRTSRAKQEGAFL